MPWERAAKTSCGLKGREKDLGPWETTSDRALAALQAAWVYCFPPRASACGLSPGLGSPGPLGRFGRRF
jgi:hypothetical protein